MKVLGAYFFLPLDRPLPADWLRENWTIKDGQRSKQEDQSCPTQFERGRRTEDGGRTPSRDGTTQPIVSGGTMAGKIGFDVTVTAETIRGRAVSLGPQLFCGAHPLQSKSALTRRDAGALSCRNCFFTRTRCNFFFVPPPVVLLSSRRPRQPPVLHPTSLPVLVVRPGPAPPPT